MYLLYVDESGKPDDPAINHFVLAGVAVFERQGYWLSKELEKIAARFDPADPKSVELHGNPMVQGRQKWKQYPRQDRTNAIKDAFAALNRSNVDNKIFAIVVEKGAIIDEDPVEYAFEQLCSRFDLYLKRKHHRKDTQRGLLVFDESTYENKFQALARDFGESGHRWGKLQNIAEVPLFADSKASRLIQLADLIAYSIFRYYEKNDDRFFNSLKSRFDKEGGKIHGLCYLSKQ